MLRIKILDNKTKSKKLMKIEKFVLFLLIFGGNVTFGQTVYYKLKGKPIMNEQYFEAVKKGYAKIGDFTVETISTETRNDSVIKNIGFKLVKLHANEEKYVSPFAKHEAKIGQRFPIEQFINADKKMFATEDLKGKPSFINFWFTRCPPCIEEIPVLNALKKEFGDSVNFIAITFDSQEVVDAFLLKKNINFLHITDAKKQLDDLEVRAYPMTLLLDKNGVVTSVHGNFEDKKEIENEIKKLL